jgi:kinetochore protein Nuf2
MNRIRKEVRNDRFPLLDVPELSICLKSCNLNAPEDDLLKPSPIFIQSLFQQILEIFLFVPVSTFQERSTGDDDDQEESYETMNLIKLHRHLYKFFVDCGVYDFILTDLIKPESQRIKRLLSAIVNFARFREEHLYDNEGILKANNLKFEKYQTLQQEYQKISNYNSELNAKIEKFHKEHDNVDNLNAYNVKVEKELKSLKKVQESLTIEHLNYKNEKSRLIQILEDHNYLLLESKRNLDKWKSYLIESPEILNKILTDLNNSLKIDEASLNQLEVKSRNLSISINSIQLIDQDLKNFLNVINEIKFDVKNEKTQNDKLNKLNEQFNDSNFQINEFDRKIQLLSRQIKNLSEKYQRILNQKTTKKQEFDKKINELNSTYSKLIDEKTINDKQIFDKKQYIETMEKKIVELKNSYDLEYNETSLEIQKLNSHLNLYVNQIEKKLELV